MKLKIDKGGNYSLSVIHKENIQVIFHNFMDQLISSIKLKLKLNLWFTAPRGATPVNCLADGSTTG